MIPGTSGLTLGSNQTTGEGRDLIAIAIDLYYLLFQGYLNRSCMCELTVDDIVARLVAHVYRHDLLGRA